MSLYILLNLIKFVSKPKKKITRMQFSFYLYVLFQALLKASIESQEPLCALAVVFLVDRFLYWTDESSRLLKITKLLHKLHPEAPVSPQLVIRQARVYLNSGTYCWKNTFTKLV